ncbi:MAG: universal stress protein [Paracoccaceae bacterium]|nr:universal stress protein [Paracoccaceae bacterium]
MYKNILVPVDPGHEVIHEQSLKMARNLAEDANTVITALTVVEPLPAYLAGELPDEVSKMAGERAMATLRYLTSGSSDIVTAIRRGSPGQEILQYAHEHDCDLIVIASHKPGLRDYFLGSTAARVVRHAACSVHVMR